MQFLQFIGSIRLTNNLPNRFHQSHTLHMSLAWAYWLVVNLLFHHLAACHPSMAASLDPLTEQPHQRSVFDRVSEYSETTIPLLLVECPPHVNSKIVPPYRLLPAFEHQALVRCLMLSLHSTSLDLHGFHRIKNTIALFLKSK